MENEDTLLTINQQEPDELKHLVNIEQGHQVICLFAECGGRFYDHYKWTVFRKQCWYSHFCEETLVGAGARAQIRFEHRKMTQLVFELNFF